MRMKKRGDSIDKSLGLLGVRSFFLEANLGFVEYRCTTKKKKEKNEFVEYACTAKKRRKKMYQVELMLSLLGK